MSKRSTKAMVDELINRIEAINWKPASRLINVYCGFRTARSFAAEAPAEPGTKRELRPLEYRGYRIVPREQRVAGVVGGQNS